MKKVMLTALAVGLGMTANLMAQVPSYVPANGLVAWYPFNGNATDESGNGNNGTVNGATLTTDRFGNNNSAYHFNNSGNIQAGEIQFQNYLGSGFTISYWFTMEDSVVSNNRHFLISNYDGINGLQIEYGPSTTNTLRHSLRTGSSTPPEINYHESFQIFNNWKHAIFVWSPTQMKTYINGVLTNQTTGNQISNLSVCCNIKTRLGSQWNNTSNHMGKLDDVGIWNRALTPQEISDLYNANVCANDLIISPSINSIQTGNTANFTATTSDANSTFTWQSDFGQGFQILNDFGNYSGTNTNALSISNVQLAHHNQQIRAISSNTNCTDTSNVAAIQIADTCITTVYDTLLTTVTDTLIINTTLSLPAPNNENTILIYPNPASDHITIDNGNFTAMAGYSIKIENNAGQQVFQSAINQAQFYVDLSTWTGNGLYFVHLIDPQNNTLTIRKIVIQ